MYHLQLFYRRLRHSRLFIPLMALMLLLPAGSAAAADIKLAWDPSQDSDLAGYKIHYGTASGSYSKTINVGNRTDYAVTGLADGTTYYFAATAYNTAGQESGYSNQVSGTTPAAAALGISNLLPGDYQIAALRTGDFYYTDRSFRVAAMPPGFEGMTAIKTANNDKLNKQAAFLSFTIDRDMDLYVAYDARAIRMPSWLTAEYTDTGLILDTSDVTFTLWRKTAPAGNVVLPGNYYGSPSGVESNYFILLAPASGDHPAPTPSLAISNLQPSGYRVTNLRNGDLHYTDRSFTVTSLPAGFEGMSAIRTANNDKYNAQAQLLSFTINESATLYVAFDSRATVRPSWLTAGFTNTGLVIKTSDVAMTLWQKTVPAGTVTLPGNYYGGTAGVDSNYFVMLAPAVSAVKVANLRPSAYQVAPLRVGNTYYVDRSFTVTAMPAGFAGMTAIKTANNDKWNNQADFISFTLDRNATLYLAYDARATTVPWWVSDNFTNTGLSIKTSDVSMNIWKRAVPAGTVVLPGNFFGSPVGVGSNYLVLVD